MRVMDYVIVDQHHNVLLAESESDFFYQIKGALHRMGVPTRKLSPIDVQITVPLETVGLTKLEDALKIAPPVRAA